MFMWICCQANNGYLITNIYTQEALGNEERETQKKSGLHEGIESALEFSSHILFHEFDFYHYVVAVCVCYTIDSYRNQEVKQKWNL